MANRARASFISPILLLKTETLPEGDDWMYELKLDGYRAIAFKSRGKVHLRSRRETDFDHKYPLIVAALAGMPDETIIDGEVVALDDTDMPSFNALQNLGSTKTPILYYVFDVMMLQGVDLMRASADLAPDRINQVATIGHRQEIG